MLSVLFNKSLQSEPLIINDFSRLSIVLCNKLKSQASPGYNQQSSANVGMADKNSPPSSSNKFSSHRHGRQNRQRVEQNHQNNVVVNPAHFAQFTNYAVNWPLWQTRQFPNNLVCGNVPPFLQPQVFGNMPPFAQPQVGESRYRQRRGAQNTITDLRFWQNLVSGNNTGGFVFTVMSYNILAQDLLDQHLFLYASHKKETLKWSVRWNNLFAEISRLKPDILCLQEVQNSHLSSHFSKFKTLGYSGVYKQRTGGKTDGCAIYYKNQKLKLVEHVTVEYNQPHVAILDRDNVGIIAKFSPLGNPQKEFLVATTHLLYNPKRQDVKLAQTQLLLTEIDRIAFVSKSKYLPVILTGDLNVPPDSAVYKLIIKGKLKYENLSLRSLQSGVAGPKTGKGFLPKSLRITDECQHANLLPKRETNVRISRSEELKAIELKHSEREKSANKQNSDKEKTDLFSSGTLRHRLSFKSVYQHIVDRDSEATTYQDGWISVDYIFYSQQANSKELTLLERYRLPTERELGDVTIPNANLGSDHLSLLAKFQLK